MSGSNLALTPLSDTAETKAAQNFQMAGEINFQMCSKTRARTKPFRQGIQCVGAGWGGRDRTSEWRNQNPLPYRLATPQLAALENDGTTAYRRFPPPPPVYRGRAAISTAGQQNPSPPSPPAMESPVAQALGAPIRRNLRPLASRSLELAHGAVEGPPVSWEYGGPVPAFPGPEILP